MIPLIVYPSLTAALIPKLQAFLNDRPEPYAAAVQVSSKLGAAKRAVTVTQAPGSGAYNTLDDTTLRVNVYHPDKFDCEDLAILVRAWFESKARDGDPVVGSRVNSGPVEIPNDLQFSQWYMVVDVTRRGQQLA